MDEMQALAQSIGEHVLLYLGRERIGRLEVLLDTQLMEGRVTVLLDDNSDQAQLMAFEKFAEVEDIFSSEASLQLALASTDWRPSVVSENAPAFVLA